MAKSTEDQKIITSTPRTYDNSENAASVQELELAEDIKYSGRERRRMRKGKKAQFQYKTILWESWIRDRRDKRELSIVVEWCGLSMVVVGGRGCSAYLGASQSINIVTARARPLCPNSSESFRESSQCTKREGHA